MPDDSGPLEHTPSTPPAAPDGAQPWSVAHKLAFRVMVAYFAIYLLAMPTDASDATRRVTARSWGVLSDWFAIRLFNAPMSTTSGRIDVNSARFALSQHTLMLLCAALIALIWSWRDARRPHYRKLEGAMRLLMRYYLACIVMVYAGVKVVPVQFPRPDLEQLAQPLGAMTPMALLWTFMGYSPAYTIFAGLAEWTGAFLLFFRRTSTLGALILVGVMSNVALMNYAYGVPVKQLSVNLALIALSLVALDARRVLNVFWFNRGVEPGNIRASAMPRWLARARPVLKPLIVLLASAGPVAAGAYTLRAISQRSVLYGVYKAESPAASPGTAPPFLRWTQVVFARPTTMTVSYADTVVRYGVTVDTAQHTLRYWSPRESRNAHTLRYDAPTPGVLTLQDVSREPAPRLVLRSVDATRRYPLAGKIPAW